MLRIVVAADRLDIRDAIVKAAGTDDTIAIVAVARNRGDVLRQVREFGPGLIVMGLTAHSADGIDTIKEIMTETPTPIVLAFDPNDAGAVALSVDALKAGALAIVPVPGKGGAAETAALTARFVSTLKAMSQVKVVRRWRTAARGQAGRKASDEQSTAQVIAIAASTGGPAAVKFILEQLPADFPVPILIVQHISAGFTESVAAWLDAAIPLKVKVAQEGEPLHPKTVYFAPEGRHLGVANRSRILISDDPPISGFRPSGNFLFRSVARVFGRDAVGVILTGMGNDGAEGLKAMFEAGGDVLAQDEKSSVIFGMPKAAIEAGLARHVLPLEKIAAALMARAGWERA